MKRRKPPEPRKLAEHKREFFCQTCNDKEAPPMSPPEVKKHLTEIHKVESTKGNRKMIMCLDGDNYHNTFEWTFGTIVVTEVQSGPK